jgi:alpha-mannosidase
VLDLNLLRSPSYPDPEADRAEHTFTYSLYPHMGDHVQAEIYKRGYELNVPLRVVAVQASSGTGKRPESYSFLQPSHPNVMVETVKKAEDGDELSSGCTKRREVTFTRRSKQDSTYRERGLQI